MLAVVALGIIPNLLIAFLNHYRLNSLSYYEHRYN